MNIHMDKLYSSRENDVHNAIGLIYLGESHKNTLLIPLVIIITNKGKYITL
jgi:hypothetical protein